jgi:hypothetical protein
LFHDLGNASHRVREPGIIVTPSDASIMHARVGLVMPGLRAVAVTERPATDCIDRVRDR